MWRFNAPTGVNIIVTEGHANRWELVEVWNLNFGSVHGVGLNSTIVGLIWDKVMQISKWEMTVTHGGNYMHDIRKMYMDVDKI